MQKGRHSTFCYGFIFKEEQEKFSFKTNIFFTKKEFNPNTQELTLIGYLSDSLSDVYLLSIENPKQN